MAPTPGADALQPRNAEEEEAIDSLLSHLITRVSGVISRYVKPSDFSPPADDPQPVVIASWMKSGTTLTQQLVYQLLVATGRVPTDPTGTDHDDISTVVPFIEMTQLHVAASPHPYRPTAWKTHSGAAEFTGPAYARARFLVAVRRGRPVMRSFADFAVEWVGGRPVPQALRAPFYDRFFRAFFLGCGDGGRARAAAPHPVEWFAHVRDWRDAEALRGRVLFLIYEDVVKDMPRAVRDVARFIGVDDADDAAVAAVVKRCSRDAMVGDPRFLDRNVARVMGFDQNGGERVRAEGKAGGFQDVVSEDTARLYDEMFEQAFGVKTYEELQEQLRARNREVLPEVGE